MWTQKSLQKPSFVNLILRIEAARPWVGKVYQMHELSEGEAAKLDSELAALLLRGCQTHIAPPGRRFPIQR